MHFGKARRRKQRGLCKEYITITLLRKGKEFSGEKVD
jgi:hypothetical protein